jgi:lysyl-tRNA synthetase class 2
LNLILGSQIEPTLGQNGKITVLTYYPASQAALAGKRWHQEEYVAERFEVYQDGVELANGYHELTDAVEQRARFHEANECRKNLGKETLPIDEFFLHALAKGIPDCSGVAVGFDRLMMLRQKQKHIGSVIAWDWNEA